MYEITVDAGFSSGHYLRNYKGKCENPHGHNYKVRVTLAGTTLDEAGLLLDFKLLKHVLRPVIERIDHQMLNDLEPFTVLNPSAENLAKYFYDETRDQLQAYGASTGCGRKPGQLSHQLPSTDFRKSVGWHRGANA